MPDATTAVDLHRRHQAPPCHRHARMTRRPFATVLARIAARRLQYRPAILLMAVACLSVAPNAILAQSPSQDAEQNGRQAEASNDNASVNRGDGNGTDSRRTRRQDGEDPGPTPAGNENGNAADEPAPSEADSEADDSETDDSETAAKPGFVDLTSPRATMRTFLLAVEEARREDPNRINDAVKALDLTNIPADQRKERGPSAARRLYDIVDQIGVRLEDVPEETSQGEYVFHRGDPVDNATGEDDGKPITPIVSIGLDYDTERWRFTTDTIASLPLLETQRKELKAQAPKPDAQIPIRYRSPRSLMQTFIESMNETPPDYATAASCFDPGGFKEDVWQAKSRELAVQLKTVMDKTRLVVLSEIPEVVPGGESFVWHTSDAGSIEISRIEEGPLQGQWRFSQATSQSLESLYTSLQDEQIIAELREAGVTEQLTLALRIEQSVPPYMRNKFLYLAVWQWLAIVALVVAGWLIRLLFSWLTGIAVLAITRAVRKIDRDAFHRALRWSGYVAAVAFYLVVVPRLGFPARLLAVAIPLIKFMFAISVTWFGYRVADVLALYVLRDEEFKLTQADDLLLPLLRAVMKTVVGILVILFVMEWFFDQPPSTVLGALGIGGVAIAFAAKDTLGNFFGSLTVLFDRPFGIGDWIAIAGVEGTVEHVGFRSTRIRTFYNSRITVPNSVLATANIDNFGERRYRRLKTLLSVTYDTPPDKIEALCEGIRELIRLHQYTRKDYYQVYFYSFAPSSLDILIYAFLDTPDWSTELRERHNLFLDIKRLAERLGVEFAFPTQSLWLHQSPDQGEERAVIAKSSGNGLPEDSADLGVDAAASIFTDTYGSEGRQRLPARVETAPRSRPPGAAPGP